MSRATTLVSVNQQLAVSAGVAVGAASVETTMWLSHVSELNATDFAPAFVVVALTSAVIELVLLADARRRRPRDLRPQGGGHRQPQGRRQERGDRRRQDGDGDTQDMRDQRLG